jgi:hypothetical protein
MDAYAKYHELNIPVNSIFNKAHGIPNLLCAGKQVVYKELIDIIEKSSDKRYINFIYDYEDGKRLLKECVYKVYTTDKRWPWKKNWFWVLMRNNYVPDDDESDDQTCYTYVATYMPKGASSEVLIEAEKFAAKIDNLKTPVPKKEKKIYCIVSDGSRLQLVALEIKEPDIDFDLNYNDDFKSIHEGVFNSLQNDPKGLFMFHGTSGTGKTTYIKWLCANLDKKIVYLPSGASDVLTSPEFLPFMISELSDCILVIEDAERVVAARGTGGSDGAVSNLLNVIDGLLSDGLKIQIMCTFNQSIDNVDEALMRPGRLKFQYEFNELTLKKSIALADKLDREPPVKPSTLAEIYVTAPIKKEKKSIGFK